MTRVPRVPSIEKDRVALLNAWGFFRERLRQQRGERKRVAQRSLLPMLEQLLEELRQGYEVESVVATIFRGEKACVSTKKKGDTEEKEEG